MPMLTALNRSCLPLFAGLALAASAAQAAQRERVPPPEPSFQPMISARSVQELRTAAERYEAIVAAGGWPALPARTTLRPGDSDEAVALLRRRLQMSGDLASSRGGYGFDQEVEEALKGYQRRHGLEPNGVVYGITLRSLNVPADVRLRQLQLNLARAQEVLPRLARARRYILMNSASFELQAIAEGRVELVSRTIAGKRTTPTPVVSATLQALNVLPYWHVPGTIAKAALVPAVRKDPGYLTRERIRVFSSFGGEEIDPAQVNWWGPEVDRLVFRQDPGPHNALGLLRFDMPNKHIVYMHDTPSKRLFDSYERAFSAGCVRIQSFYALADWALAGQDGWTQARLQEATSGDRGITIKLAHPVAVHFVYLTAWVEEGAVNFRNDLYNRDEGAFEGGEEPSARLLVREIAP